MSARRLLCSIGLGACLLVVSGCDVIDLQAQNGAEGTFERTLNVSGPVDLDVRTGAGDITITVGADNTVHALGRIRARASWFGSSEAIAPQTFCMYSLASAWRTKENPSLACLAVAFNLKREKSS